MVTAVYTETWNIVGFHPTIHTELKLHIGYKSCTAGQPSSCRIAIYLKVGYKVVIITIDTVNFIIL
jgi:hypothetical protein